jgi:nucleotide-binding universal stress UspA family protein
MISLLNHLTILILPLDGSTASDRIVPIVRDLAAQLSASVRVLHVFADINQLRRASVGDVDWSEHAEPRAHISPPASIRDSCTLLQSSGISVETIGRVGVASTEILREAGRQDDSWIVMASKGAGGFRQLFMGSTATAVARAANQPLILIPSEITANFLDSLDQHALVSVFVDGTQESETAIEPAAMLAGRLNSRLDVVRVAETMRDDPNRPTPDDEKWEIPELERIRDYLETQSKVCSGKYGIEVSPVALAGSPGVQLLRYAESARPGLIALATQRRSGIERWTYGSMAEHLVARLQTPLLLIPVE